MGGYEIVAHLKPGGMATLFLARRVGTRGFAVPVAIKVVHPHLASDANLVRMFLDEANLGALIQHPNVVRIEDLGEADGAYFLAMEYVHGETLSSLLSALARVEGRVPVEVAAWIASSTAAGLHAAHLTRAPDGSPLGIVHRDVSPQNILASIEGHVKLIDFGIAKARSSTSQATEIGGLKGKLTYMSPEQASGGEIDARTDVYALGIVLWEMLTLRRLFSRPTEVEVLEAVRSPEVVPPSSFARDVPAALDAVVLRALAFDPRDRFRTAGELAEAITEAVPASSAHGATELAQLVRTMLGDRIEERRSALTQRLDASARTRAPVADHSNDRTIAGPARTTPPELASGPRSLAVMSFRATGSARELELGEGLADDLRDLLSRVRGVRVKGRLPTQGEAEDATGYGKRVGVDLIVTGRVQPAADRFRLSVALTGASEGYQLWASRFECAHEELLDVSDKVARSLAGALGDLQLRGDVRTSTDPAMVEVMFRMRKVAAGAGVSDEFDIGAVDRALALAPRDPQVLALVAVALSREALRPEAPANFGERARAAAERAIELGPELPESWFAMAQIRYVQRDTSAAVHALRRAITTGPSFAQAHELLGRILSDAGLIDEAIGYLDHAIWLDPSCTFALLERARVHGMRGEWDGATRSLAALRLHSPQRHVIMTRRLSLWARRRLGDLDATGTAPHLGGLLASAKKILETGRFEAEDEEAARAIIAAASPGSRPRRWYRQMEAEVRAFAGDREGTIAAVIASVADGLEDVAWLDHCPLLADVRHDPALAPAVAEARARAELVKAAWDEW